MWWDQGAGNDAYVVLAASTGNNLDFTKQDNLFPGAYYKFKVKAINNVGASDFSSALLIITSTKPGKPGTPVKYLASISSIEIRWAAPNPNFIGNGGSVITDYKVYWD